MQTVTLLLLSCGGLFPIGVQAPAPAEKQPVLQVTDYRGLAGPLTHFDMFDDGTWTYLVDKGGKRIESAGGRFTTPQRKDLLEFFRDLDLAKHARKRNVEDAAMLSVCLNDQAFLDLVPQVASRVRDRMHAAIGKK